MKRRQRLAVAASLWIGACALVLLGTASAGAQNIIRVAPDPLAHTLQIDGSGFGDAPGQVDIGGVILPTISWVRFKIVVSVPQGVVAGSYRLGVKPAGAPAPTYFAFTFDEVTPPGVCAPTLPSTVDLPISFSPGGPNLNTSINLTGLAASDADHKVRFLWFDPNGKVVPEAIALLAGNSVQVFQQGLTPGASTHPIPGLWGVVVCYETGGITDMIGRVRIAVAP